MNTHGGYVSSLEEFIVYDYYLSKRRRCSRRYCSVNNAAAAAHATVVVIGRIRYMAAATVNETSDHAWHASDCVKWFVLLACGRGTARYGY